MVRTSFCRCHGLPCGNRCRLGSGWIGGWFGKRGIQLSVTFVLLWRFFLHRCDYRSSSRQGWGGVPTDQHRNEHNRIGGEPSTARWRRWRRTSRDHSVNFVCLLHTASRFDFPISWLLFLVCFWFWSSSLYLYVGKIQRTKYLLIFSSLPGRHRLLRQHFRRFSITINPFLCC